MLCATQFITVDKPNDNKRRIKKNISHSQYTRFEKRVRGVNAGAQKKRHRDKEKANDEEADFDRKSNNENAKNVVINVRMTVR